MNDQKLDLVSYLIMPIQRIPRYQLLLQVRTKFTGLTRVKKPNDLFLGLIEVNAKET